MDDTIIPKNDAVLHHILKSNDDDRTEMDTKSSNENGSNKRMNQKCQDSAKNNENIPTEREEGNPKYGTENIPPEHFSLDALESTKVAVAQFAAAALSKGPNESSVKDLTMLQSALFTLQHQQVFQMQLIEQLQYQLAKTSTKRDKKRKISQTKLEIEEENVEADLEVPFEENNLITATTEW